MIGQRFGKLCVTGQAGTSNGHIMLACRCDCGGSKSVRKSHLKANLIKSCGCLKNKTKRGYIAADVSEYWIWLGIKQRCLNPNHSAYYKYGGRGISICTKWESSFEAFYADMGPRPSKKHSVDRIDNSGNYEPGNCRWADITTQSRNTRYNRVLEWNGTKKCVVEWGEELGIKPNTIVCRLRSGLTVEQALTTPVAYRKPRVKRSTGAMA